MEAAAAMMPAATAVMSAPAAPAAVAAAPAAMTTAGCRGRRRRGEGHAERQKRCA